MFKIFLSLTITLSFILATLDHIPSAQAQLALPAPGTMVNLSPSYEPVIIKGLTVHKDNPFLFDFIVDIGQDKMSGEPLKKEGEKLIKYFLAGLAIPDKDLWVNLSPYEKKRMIPEALGQTDMGRDLLEQDYILKQITASLIYPEKKLGRIFWDKVYAKAQEIYGTTQIPVNTFNKVWITADKAEVFEHNQTAFVVGQHLKVMLEEDYLALQKHNKGVIARSEATKQSFKEIAASPSAPRNDMASIGGNIVRQIILPQLEKEVNTGENFANLRQIFNSIILSSWYKKNLEAALLNQVYANKAKVKGIDLNDPTIKQKIYEQYLKAYKKGVFNYIKDDVDAAGIIIPRKYFSGGLEVGAAAPGRLTVIVGAAMGVLAMSKQHFYGEMDFRTGLRMRESDAAMAEDRGTPDVSFTFVKLDNPKAPKRLGKGETVEIKRNTEIQLKVGLLGNRFCEVKYDNHGTITVLDENKEIIDRWDVINGHRNFYKINDEPVIKIFSYGGGCYAKTLGEPDEAMNGTRQIEEMRPVLDALLGKLHFNPRIYEILEKSEGSIYITPFDTTNEKTRSQGVRLGVIIPNTVFNKFELVDEIDRLFKAQIAPEDFKDYTIGFEKSPEITQEAERIAPFASVTFTRVNDADVPDYSDLFGNIGQGLTFYSEKKPRAYSGGIVQIISQMPGGHIIINPMMIDVHRHDSIPKIKVEAGFLSLYSDIVQNWENLGIVKAAVSAWDRKFSNSVYAFSAIYSTGPIGYDVESVGYDGHTVRGENVVTVIIRKTSDRAMQGRGQKVTGAQSVAAAMTTPGGIDLNTSNGMRWKDSRDGNGVEMNIDQAQIARIEREGIEWLRPKILKMTPIASVWPLMGLKAPA